MTFSLWLPILEKKHKMANEEGGERSTSISVTNPGLRNMAWTWEQMGHLTPVSRFKITGPPKGQRTDRNYLPRGWNRWIRDLDGAMWAMRARTPQEADGQGGLIAKHKTAREKELGLLFNNTVVKNTPDSHLPPTPTCKSTYPTGDGGEGSVGSIVFPNMRYRWKNVSLYSSF